MSTRPNIHRTKTRNRNRSSVDPPQYYLVFSSNSLNEFVWKCEPNKVFTLGRNGTFRISSSDGTVITLLPRVICEYLFLPKEARRSNFDLQHQKIISFKLTVETLRELREPFLMSRINLI